MSVKEKKPLSDAQKKKVADYYIKKRIESNIEEKRNAIIKQNYVEKEIEKNTKDAQNKIIRTKYIDKETQKKIILCARKHKSEAYSSGDNSQRAYQNCRSRCPGFVGSREEYKIQMEERFIEGMCWENYPEWETDHIIPLAKGGLHHVKNLQPLWMTINRSKGATIEFEFDDYD